MSKNQNPEPKKEDEPKTGNAGDSAQTEGQTEAEKAAATAEAPAKAQAPAASEVKQESTKTKESYLLQTQNGFNYTDPETNISYSANITKVNGPIRKGSWLDVQMDAKLIVEA